MPAAASRSSLSTEESSSSSAISSSVSASDRRASMPSSRWTSSLSELYSVLTARPTSGSSHRSGRLISFSTSAKRVRLSSTRRYRSASARRLRIPASSSTRSRTAAGLLPVAELVLLAAATPARLVAPQLLVLRPGDRHHARLVGRRRRSHGLLGLLGGFGVGGDLGGQRLVDGSRSLHRLGGRLVGELREVGLGSRLDQHLDVHDVLDEVVVDGGHQLAE